MTYTPTTWTNGSGQPINDDNLNKIEIGIADAHSGFEERALAITTVLPAAGSPLTGGGDLSANRTFDIETFTEAVKGAVPSPGTVDLTKYLRSDGTWAAPAEAEGTVPATRLIDTTAPLEGGGTLDTDLSLSILDFTETESGAVPPPVTIDLTKFLRSDGSWQVPAGPARYNADVGGSTAVVLSHTLGTRDVSVQLYRNSTPWENIEVGVADLTAIERTDTNTVTIRFSSAPAAAAFRAVIQA
jgi:hypothetical protein